ncbi:MAG: HAMP domain-containing histidine kinase [Proteobacteria bacterium]|nr:HAMP domain-containing histidine kinase [Pseudomonadota bacterium]
MALPKSLNGYLLLGIGVITMPLLAAILHATFQMRRLTDYSQKLVNDSVRTTELIQDMFEMRNSLAHEAQVYQVLATSQDLAKFNDQDAALGTTMGELRPMLRDPAARTAIDVFVALQRDIADAVRSPPALPEDGRAAPPLRTIPDFGALDDQALRISHFANAQKVTELASLDDQTVAARRELFWESSLLIPLALAATLSFALGIGRPIRQVDRAITELGGGDFGREIAVSGPVDLQRLGQQLEWLRKRLLDLAQERNRFLRHMSHELKTPLANIREGTELLMDGAVGELRPGQREVTAILQENSIKLQRMIENLLSYSAWQSNSVGLDAAEFRLRPLVKQVLENQQLTLVSQRVRLDVQIDDITMIADRGKLRLILENLLSNAIKYSPRGGTITMRARAVGTELVLEVADGGAGIPPAERANVFEAFHTGRAPGGHVRGTGIGLSVVHEFVQVHGGSIEIVDGEFRGAHFRIHIPLRAGAAPLPTLVTGTALPRRKAHAA